MSLLFAAALAVSATTLPVCSWDRPGANPFMGDVVAAVDRYGDIPESVRTALKKRMAERRYDDIAVIRRDSVVGKHRYSPEIRDMHFGPGQVCRTVTRSQWSPAAEERGLVYCESGQCIIVPTVCRNVSRVKRLPAERTAAATEEALPAAGDGAGTGAGTGPAVLLASADPAPIALGNTAAGELSFEAPAAGLSFAQQADPAQPAQLVSTSPMPGANGGGTPIEASPADNGFSASVAANPVVGGSGGGSGGGGGGYGPGGGSSNVGGGGSGGGGGWGGIPVAGNSTSGSPGQPGSGPGVTAPGDFIAPPGPGGLVVTPTTPPVTAVPEPGTWALWLLGLAALIGAARRRQPIS